MVPLYCPASIAVMTFGGFRSPLLPLKHSRQVALQTAAAASQSTVGIPNNAPVWPLGECAPPGLTVPHIQSTNPNSVGLQQRRLPCTPQSSTSKTGAHRRSIRNGFVPQMHSSACAHTERARNGCKRAIVAGKDQREDHTIQFACARGAARYPCGTGLSMYTAAHPGFEMRSQEKLAQCVAWRQGRRPKAHGLTDPEVFRGRFCTAHFSERLFLIHFATLDACCGWNVGTGGGQGGRLYQSEDATPPLGHRVAPQPRGRPLSLGLRAQRGQSAQ